MSKQPDLVKFAEAVDEGLNSRQLGERFGITWQLAAKMRKQLQDETAAIAGNEQEPAGPTTYELKVSVPEEELLRGLPHTELLEAILSCDKVDQATVLQQAIQKRMDRLFDQPVTGLELPTLELVASASRG